MPDVIFATVETTDWLILLGVLLGAPLTTYLTNRATKPKVIADVSETYMGMGLQLVTPQRDRIAELEEGQEKLRDELKSESRDCRDRIEQVEAWAKLLYTHLVEIGETPVTFDQSIHMHRRKDD